MNRFEELKAVVDRENKKQAEYDTEDIQERFQLRLNPNKLNNPRYVARMFQAWQKIKAEPIKPCYYIVELLKNEDGLIAGGLYIAHDNKGVYSIFRSTDVLERTSVQGAKGIRILYPKEAMQ